MRRVLIGAALAALCAPAHAQCVIDSTGASFTNPTAPECRSQAFTFTENDAGGSNLALGYPTPQPVESLTGVDGFRSYASLLARHQDLMTVHPHVQGTVVGTTRAGNAIWAYVLGDADDRKADGSLEPAVMVNGGIHAREWQSPEAVSETLEQLAAMAQDGGFWEYLRDSVTQVIVPVLNIDGFLQTQRWPTRVVGSASQPRDGRMRRKNLRHPSRGTPVDMDLDTTDDNLFGVDLNRNSVHGFGLNNSSTLDTFSLVYRGPAAASEPEIQALQAAAALGPDSRLRLYTDVHSFSQIFFTQMIGDARRDAITRELMNRLRAVTDFRYRDGSSAPQPLGVGGIGLTADYFAYEYRIPSWTLETEPLSSGAQYGGTGISHSGFVLPDSEVRRMREEVASMLILGAYAQAGPPAVAALEFYAGDCAAADADATYAARWETQASGTERTLNVTANRALVPGQPYCLWLAFDKPMRVRDDANAVTNYTGQSVALNPGIVLATATEELVVPGTDVSWLNQAAPAPGGFLRYADDALAVTVTLPDSWNITTATPLVVQIATDDAASRGLDTNPATAADWADGHWTGYE
ncbi:MAG: M14 family metallopeptidase, partial [Pseudomonadota bacterium]